MIISLSRGAVAPAQIVRGMSGRGPLEPESYCEGGVTGFCVAGAGFAGSTGAGAGVVADG